jgi:hypothetical protein
MHKSKNYHAKLKKSEKPLTNALLDDLLKTGIFRSPFKEELSSEVEKLLEDF